MACSNCYSGCVETSSDKCIMYTGVDVPVLGIVKGDSLSYVEQALITFLTSTLNGSGITIEMDEDFYCELVSQYLQECSTVTALDLFKALVQAACNLQEQIDTINETLTELNSDYDIECLSGVSDSSDTHDVVQAIITKLCEIDVDLAALALDVDTNYVKISNLNSYIQAYLDSVAVTNRYSSRMVPYCPIPYIGSLSFFDATGAGIAGTEWEDIYLCNGLNSTPDLRGRAITGAISGVPGGALSSVVDPMASAFNPNYALGTLAGANSVVLLETQIPAHTHTAQNAGEHTHEFLVGATDGVTPNIKAFTTGSTGSFETDEAGDHTHTINSTGGGEGHANIQPVFATYYIIYLP